MFPFKVAFIGSAGATAISIADKTLSRCCTGDMRPLAPRASKNGVGAPDKTRRKSGVVVLADEVLG